MSDLARRADLLLAKARDAGMRIVVAESCTAGLLSRLLSDAEGAGLYFAGGFVVYTKDQKTAALGVPHQMLVEKTAVCREVARAMAEGALARSAASVAAAITGVAGPEPDEDGNPVGRVCIAISRAGQPTRDLELHYGPIGREAIRERAMGEALDGLIDTVSAVSAAA